MPSSALPLLLSTFAIQTLARQITFPPLVPQIPLSQHGAAYNPSIKTPGLGYQTSEFRGLTTFGNLPYVWALKDAENDEVEKFDIAFMGAPFDTVSNLPSSFWHPEPEHIELWVADTYAKGTTGRPGTRFGPGGIRLGSRRMEIDSYSIYTGTYLARF